MAGGRGDTGEMLQEIESDPFRRKDSARLSGDAGDNAPGRRDVSFLHMRLDNDLRIKRPESGRHQEASRRCTRLREEQAPLPMSLPGR